MSSLRFLFLKYTRFFLYILCNLSRVPFIELNFPLTVKLALAHNVIELFVALFQNYFSHILQLQFFVLVYYVFDHTLLFPLCWFALNSTSSFSLANFLKPGTKSLVIQSFFRWIIETRKILGHERIMRGATEAKKKFEISWVFELIRKGWNNVIEFYEES